MHGMLLITWPSPEKLYTYSLVLSLWRYAPLPDWIGRCQSSEILVKSMEYMCGVVWFSPVETLRVTVGPFGKALNQMPIYIKPQPLERQGILSASPKSEDMGGLRYKVHSA